MWKLGNNKTKSPAELCQSLFFLSHLFVLEVKCVRSGSEDTGCKKLICLPPRFKACLVETLYFPQSHAALVVQKFFAADTVLRNFILPQRYGYKLIPKFTFTAVCNLQVQTYWRRILAPVKGDQNQKILRSFACYDCTNTIFLEQLYYSLTLTGRRALPTLVQQFFSAISRCLPLRVRTNSLLSSSLRLFLSLEESGRPSLHCRLQK